jgi:ribosomal protein S18 acetylase RimI-like enzyme
MKLQIRELEPKDVRDAVRILILSFERELFGIFNDLELAREILFEYFSVYRDGCFVAESERILGFASVSFSSPPTRRFFRNKLGIIRGTKISLLISYLCPKPKSSGATINFIAVSPLKREKGIGSALLRRIIDEALRAEKKEISCYVSVDNDAGISLLTKHGFQIVRMLDNSFAEKRFGQRKWYLMKLYLNQ